MQFIIFPCPHHEHGSPTTHDIPSLLSDHNRNSLDISQLQSHRQSFMADSEHSSSDDSNTGSGDVFKEGEESREESKLEFSQDEEMLIIRMHNLVRERWSLIAGRIPGRTAEEIEKYWNSTYSTSE